MKAAIYENFSGPIQIKEVAQPELSRGSVVIQVKATGICRSDWWGWKGNDSDIQLPHIPGHELAGVIISVASDVQKWKVGERVTVPFVGGCGSCAHCSNGQQQVCDHQFQPGFTSWGSFAEFVRIKYADENLVRIPDQMSFIEAASLGCRFITSYRALIYQGKLKKGELVAIHGCGGVGLSAIMIASAIGAKVVAVDISNEKLDFARSLGADMCINVLGSENAAADVKERTIGGVHVSVDALGHPKTCLQSIHSLRKQGRHVQVGLLEGVDPTIALPMNLITGHELEIYGSHGMQASKYPEIFSLISQGLLNPGRIVTDVVSLERGVEILVNMEHDPPKGIAVIEMDR